MWSPNKANPYSLCNRPFTVSPENISENMSINISRNKPWRPKHFFYSCNFRRIQLVVSTLPIICFTSEYVYFFKNVKNPVQKRHLGRIPVLLCVPCQKHLISIFQNHCFPERLAQTCFRLQFIKSFLDKELEILFQWVQK